ncbi:MAG: penicillin-binding protein, partial [Hydrogenophilales bacterium 16-62-9]
MTNMMQDVVRHGTAARANQLGRSDIAGKTGTTNDARDTWFAGFSPDLVAIAWMGYDQPRSLGRSETGAQSALPIWLNFMGAALKGVPQKGWPMPGGIIPAQIDPATGARASASLLDAVLGTSPGMTEYFYQEFPPPDATGVDWDTESDSFAAPGHAAEPAIPAKPASPGTPAKAPVTVGTPI